MDNEYLQAMADDGALTVSLKSDWLFARWPTDQGSASAFHYGKGGQF